MAIAALVTWLITAGFGSFMLIRWATRGVSARCREQGRTSHESGCSRILGWPPQG